MELKTQMSPLRADVVSGGAQLTSWREPALPQSNSLRAGTGEEGDQKGPVKRERGARSRAARCPFAWPLVGSPVGGCLCSKEACVVDSSQLLPSTEVSGSSGSCRACAEETIAMSMRIKIVSPSVYLAGAR